MVAHSAVVAGARCWGQELSDAVALIEAHNCGGVCPMSWCVRRGSGACVRCWRACYRRGSG